MLIEAKTVRHNGVVVLVHVVNEKVCRLRLTANSDLLAAIRIKAVNGASTPFHGLPYCHSLPVGKDEPADKLLAEYALVLELRSLW